MDVDRRMLFLPIFLQYEGVAQMVIVSGEFLMDHLKPLPSDANKEVSLEQIWSSNRMPFTVIHHLEGFDKVWLSNIYGSRMINTLAGGSSMFYTLDCDRLIISRQSDLSNSQSSPLLSSSYLRIGSSLPQLPLLQNGPFELLQDEKLDQCEAVMMSEDNIIFVEPVCYVGF